MKTENFIGIYSRSFFENWDLPALTDYVTGRTLTYGDLATGVAKLHAACVPATRSRSAAATRSTGCWSIWPPSPTGPS